VPFATTFNTSKCVVRTRGLVSLLTRSVQPKMAVAKDDFINCALRHRRLADVSARGLCHVYSRWLLSEELGLHMKCFQVIEVPVIFLLT
jgi:hypothetical protein